MDISGSGGSLSKERSSNETVVKQDADNGVVDPEHADSAHYLGDVSSREEENIDVVQLKADLAELEQELASLREELTRADGERPVANCDD